MGCVGHLWGGARRVGPGPGAPLRAPWQPATDGRYRQG